MPITARNITDSVCFDSMRHTSIAQSYR